jgi:hypothetical protein
MMVCSNTAMAPAHRLLLLHSRARQQHDVGVSEKGGLMKTGIIKCIPLPLAVSLVCNHRL